MLIKIAALLLLTACGVEQKPAAQTDATPQATPAAEPKSVVVEPAKKDEAETPAKPQGPVQLTKDQQLRASIRLIFDSNLNNGRLFHDEVGKTYFFKGDEGVMGYPDSTYVPATTKNVSAACPLGFKQVGQIDLSIAISRGLYDHLPPDSQWVWTSWKSSSDTNAYYAQVTSDFTDQWTVNYLDQMFYPKHKSRVLGRLYCMMTDYDLPNVDDLPPGYLEAGRLP